VRSAVAISVLFGLPCCVVQAAFTDFSDYAPGATAGLPSTEKVGDIPFDIETPVRCHLVNGNAVGLAGQLLRRGLRRADSDHGSILSIPFFFLGVLAPWRDIFPRELNLFDRHKEHKNPNLQEACSISVVLNSQ